MCRTVVIQWQDKERTVEIIRGPFTWAANNDTHCCEGWLMPEPLDPYGEPYPITFPADRILRDV